GVGWSGRTIAAALALGFRKVWGVGFSLLLAVPAILGAGVLAIKDVDRSALTPDRIAMTIAAATVAGLVGYAAIVWLLRVVRAEKLWYFSVYLIVLATVVLVGFSTAELRPHARRARAVVGPVRIATLGTVPGGRAGGGGGPLDRPLGPRARAGSAPADPATASRPGAAGLVLGGPLVDRPWGP